VKRNCREKCKRQNRYAGNIFRILTSEWVGVGPKPKRRMAIGISILVVAIAVLGVSMSLI